VKTGLVKDPIALEHDTGPMHPERPARIPAVLDALAGLPLIDVTPRDATSSELGAAHSPAYVKSIEQRIRSGEQSLDADTTVCANSWPAALRSAGAALALGEAWLAGEIEAGFSAMRPPGHHACKATAMGFCLFNNIAVLARFLHGKGKRVAILDWDVHHGNGTQDIFYDDAEVGYCSLHQSPLYPGTGYANETGAGNILNLPMRGGWGDSEYLKAFDETVVPWIEARAPDVLLVSAGFDAHEDDPLAGMKLTSDVFGEFTRRVLKWPVLSLLEGGYGLEGLAASARSHVAALCEG
jgi:acetoin utilization deacetylase AcuC-like enzyme